MATRAEVIKRVLDRLRGALGTGEEPPGSNNNFIVKWYNDNVDRIGIGPWCEMTNTWAMWTGGAKRLKTGRALTVWAAQDAEKGLNGASWHWGTAGMKAGDQVYYDWGKAKGAIGKVDHTGTVEKIVGNGTFYVLEGNQKDKLRRVLRDATYVVGYVRFDWNQLVTRKKPVTDPPVNEPKPIGRPDPSKIRLLQRALEFPKDGQDGKWGPNTDKRAAMMRTAAQAKVGWPKKSKKKFNIREVQGIIDTTVDGDWGPKSQRALLVWVANLQEQVLGVKRDGVWGPVTDNAYLVLRKNNYMKY